MSDTTTAAAAAGHKITCELCNAQVHSIQRHLSEAHAGVSLDDYKAKFPNAPLVSAALLKRKAEMDAEKKAEAARAAAGASSAAAPAVMRAAKRVTFHELFGLRADPSTLSAQGKPIPINVLGSDAGSENLIPAIDMNYVFNVDVLKTLMLGVELGIPVYLWGHAGTGKTTVFEQICARTKRPALRVQHTANMEESHVIGTWVLRDGRTSFQLGPLPQAMKMGWTYIADEYDFGRPEVSSLYQPVLEGKPLIIKEADEANRVIEPHPNFRFLATGNTNGQGDETGLYAGTTMQNAANYERFGIVEQMPYMARELEIQLVARQAKIPTSEAEKLVKFAESVRQNFEERKLSNPISPRSLIYAARLGVARKDFAFGLQMAYINRLTQADKVAAEGLSQRVFGS